jgi:hypothetical protein
MGCLFAMFGGLFPRLALLIVWIARPVLVAAAFNTFLLPLLGIIFLPFATLIYVILYTPNVGLVGFDWFWVLLAVLLDIGHWGASYTQRNQIPGVRSTRIIPAGIYPGMEVGGSSKSKGRRGRRR